MTVGDALAVWLVGTTGLVLMLCLAVALLDVVRDVLGFLRERRTPPSVHARPLRGTETQDASQDIDSDLAAVLAPYRRRGELRVLPGGRDPRSAA